MYPDGVCCAVVGSEAALCRREKRVNSRSYTVECDNGQQSSQRREQHDRSQVVHRAFRFAGLLQDGERAHAYTDVLVVLDCHVEDVGETDVQ